MNKFMKSLLAVFALITSLNTTVYAEDTNDYWVTQLRAAPGKFPALLELLKKTDWATINSPRPLMMRHSQGNHWDVMLLGPHNIQCVNTCAEKLQKLYSDIDQIADSKVTFIASSGTSWAELSQEANGKNLYHIEMFNAAAGKHAALLRQRRIENKYLNLTKQVENVIFKVFLGTDIDVFTIGFHQSLSRFAAAGPKSPEAAEEAATQAGFKNRADISFHLRELIVSHHDTLAGPVK